MGRGRGRGGAREEFSPVENLPPSQESGNGRLEESFFFFFHLSSASDCKTSCGSDGSPHTHSHVCVCGGARPPLI